MKSFVNECGCRNGFGYYDRVAREIVLKRPCFRKQDFEEVSRWVEKALNLRRFSIGYGSVDSLVVDDSYDGMYAEARSTIKQAVIPNASIDNKILSELLVRLNDKDVLANLALKCFTFAGQQECFDLLLRTITERKSLIFLDLTGCYFSDEQLIDLAKVISRTLIAHIVWPEPRMSPLVLEKVLELFRGNKSVTVMQGVPLEMSLIALRNRNELFELARNETSINEKEREYIREYKNSYRMAFGYEKGRLFEMEKTVEAIICK